jgi:hypothetical protein
MRKLINHGSTRSESTTLQNSMDKLCRSGRRMFFLGNAEYDDLEDVLCKVRRGPHAVDVHVLQHRPQHRPVCTQSMSIILQQSKILYSVGDVYPGTRIRIFSIPDPNYFHPGSRIHIEELNKFNPKKLFLSSRKFDPGCSSQIRILIFYSSRIPDPGVKKVPDPGSGSATLILYIEIKIVPVDD